MRGTIERFSKEFSLSRDETELIVATLLDRPRFQVYFNNHIETATELLLRVRFHQLKMGVPIEYITKRVQFLDFTLHINPGVFIPRFETEYFIELIIRQLSYKPSRILDIGTGCGAIVVALAKKYPEAHLFATDRSQYAIENARKNVNELNLNSRVFLLGADLFTPLKSKFDLIVCNPPYIPYERLKSLPESVKGFEPFLSLNGGKDGIQFIKRLISSGMNSLTTNGSMAIEIDEDEVEKLKNFLIINNIKNFAFEKDQFDRFRYLLIGNFNQ